MAVEFSINGAPALFAGVPKSGCRFTMGLLKQHPFDQKDNRNGQHVPEHIPGVPLYAVVRNPIDWLRSYFQNIGNPVKWEPVDSWQPLREAALDATREPTPEALTRFVESYLDGPPNRIGEMYESYQPDWSWRIEDLPRSLEDFFKRTFEYPRRWETRNKLVMEPRLMQRIRAHEPEFCKKWCY